MAPGCKMSTSADSEIARGEILLLCLDSDAAAKLCGVEAAGFSSFAALRSPEDCWSSWSAENF